MTRSSQSIIDPEDPFSQVNLVKLVHNMDFTEGASPERSITPQVSDTYNTFGEPEILPRVGEEYQAEIPSLMSKADYEQLTKNLIDEEVVGSSCHSFLIGLPIRVMWISNDITSIKREQQDAFHTDETSAANESLKPECSKEALDSGTKLGDLANSSLTNESTSKEQQMRGGKGCYLVPGSFGDTWSNIEEASLIIALYIFGKNLVQVKKFIGTKPMGDVLSYYYGKFYRSERYHRWSECRKIRSRRSMCGQRIFTGLRHQEFLSRLVPKVSEECRNSLLEISKTFGEGKMLLEEYVFTLKDKVGLNALVEAIGIGKGKHDLIGVASNQAVHVRPEIPIGKACSALTTLEIINFLTGDFRLSKARSSDLFWEAVWPRLLARGWHSEQPNSNGYAAGYKRSLVFLIPGIKKFSRRKLVKGCDYFDSVTDVLSKVASEPGLLEIEDYKVIEEKRLTGEGKVEQENFPSEQRHCYLKPRNQNQSTDIIEFTVVDTSLANGKASKVRELRTLPVQIMDASTSRSYSQEEDNDTSEETEGKSDSMDALCSDKNEADNSKAADFKMGKIDSFDGKNFQNGTSNQGIAIKVSNLNLNNIPTKILRGKSNGNCNGMPPKRVMKCQQSQKMGPENKNQLVAPFTKQGSRLPACSRKEISHGTTDSRLGTRTQHETSSWADHFDLNENLVSQLDPSSRSSRDSLVTKTEGTLNNSNQISDGHPHEKSQPHTLIDLNIPLCLDDEIDESFMIEMTQRQDNQVNKGPDDSLLVKTSECVANPEQESGMNLRRQSTRNRPLTTKVLEAFACGFMDVKQKRKRRDVLLPEEKLSSRPYQHARGRVRTSESNTSSTMDFSVEENESAVQNNDDVCTELGLGPPFS